MPSETTIPPISSPARQFDTGDRPGIYPAAVHGPIVISLSWATISRVLLSCVVVLGVLGFAVQLDKFVLGATINDNIVDALSLRGDPSIPSWYSSMTLFCCAILLAVIAMANRASGGPFTLHWAFLSLTFVALSLDEGASIHEISVRPLRNFFDAGGIFYHAWVIPALVLVPLFALAYLPSLRALPRTTACLFVGAAVLFVGGALGFELLEGSYIDAYGRIDLRYMTLVQIEEMAEMLGVVVFIYALLRYIKNHIGDIRIRAC